MPGLAYHDDGTDMAAAASVGQSLGNIGRMAFGMPQLQLQRERVRQQIILQNAQRILAEARAKNVGYQGQLYQAESKRNQAQEEQARAKTNEINARQQRVGMLADALEIMTRVGVNPVTNPGSYQAAMAPIVSSTGYLQAQKNPADLAQALAGIQRLQSLPEGDRLGLASISMGRGIPMGQSVETGVHAPIMVPRGGMVFDEANQPMMAGQPVPNKQGDIVSSFFGQSGPYEGMQEDEKTALRDQYLQRHGYNIKPQSIAPGTVYKGYKFKGGDPSKKENWTLP